MNDLVDRAQRSAGAAQHEKLAVGLEDDCIATKTENATIPCRNDVLVGRRVLTSDEVKLGEVLDVQLDTESWRVTWLVIRLHRDVISQM